jgi:hypothetical protein
VHVNIIHHPEIAERDKADLKQYVARFPAISTSSTSSSNPKRPVCQTKIPKFNSKKTNRKRKTCGRKEKI